MLKGFQTEFSIDFFGFCNHDYILHLWQTILNAVKSTCYVILIHYNNDAVSDCTMTIFKNANVLGLTVYYRTKHGM